MLRLEGIAAGYAGTQVLWDVSLEAKSGAMTVIVGPNGAGKSSILKVLTGLLRPSAGRILFKDQDITTLPAYRRPDRGIAAVPEGRRLFPELTAEANLRLGAYTPRARAKVEERMEQVYELFPGIRTRIGVKAARLSGGEQQMVAIGRALMAGPEILVLDEPSLGLAPKVVSGIFETIRRLREGGLTVLMVEQNAYQALRIADFGYVVQGGRTIRSGPPSDLLDLEALRRDYFAIG
jgi:branched-chain amino acid transport system ATP-binding protein